MAHDVFISYSSADRDAADRLCGLLEAEGLRCWMAPRNIAPGSNWSASIVEAIRNSRAFILLLSTNANQSVQIPREVDRAIDGRLPLVPVRLENVTPAGALEYSLSTVHWFDAFAGPLESHAPSLIDHIRSVSEQSEADKAEAEKRRLAALEHRRLRRRAELRRAALVAAGAAALLAVAMPLVWETGPFQAVDRSLLDWRFSLASPVSPSDSIVVVSVDDASVAGSPELLTSDVDALGRTVSRMAEAGARTIVLDLLLSERWSRSSPFADLVLRYHDKLTLAALISDDGKIIGPEALSGLISAAIGPPAAGRLFGFVNFPRDPEGWPRHVPQGFIDSAGAFRPSLAEHAIERFTGAKPSSDSTLIDFRVDAARLKRVSWKDVGMFVASGEPVFHDRLVIIGAEYAGTGDTHTVPSAEGRRANVPGVLVQALAVNTLLQGPRLHGTSRGASMVIAFAVAFLAAFAAGAWRSVAVAGLAVAGAVAALLGAAAGLFLWRQSVVPVAGPAIVAAMSVVSSALIARRRLV